MTYEIEFVDLDDDTQLDLTVEGEDAKTYISPSRMVKEFHKAMGLPIAVDVKSMKPQQLIELLDLRGRLLQEEYCELTTAQIKMWDNCLVYNNKNRSDPYHKHDEYKKQLVDILDAYVDIVYVIVGTCVALGLDFDAAFSEVHRNNMTKLGPDGKPIIADGTQEQSYGRPWPVGKVLKPEGYKPVDLTKFVEHL